MKVISIKGTEFKEMLKKETDQLEIIDVREQDEFDLVRIKGSKLIPVSEIGKRLDEVDWTKKVVLVCRSGSRSGYIAQMLAAYGKETINLQGGIYELNLDQCDCLEKSPDCCEGYF